MRFPCTLNIQARDCLPFNSRKAAPRPLVGRIQNISPGGICMLTEQPVPPGSLFYCELSMRDLPVSIPTLFQWRWTSKQNNEGVRYLTGLRFVL